MHKNIIYSSLIEASLVVIDKTNSLKKRKESFEILKKLNISVSKNDDDEISLALELGHMETIKNYLKEKKINLVDILMFDNIHEDVNLWVRKQLDLEKLNKKLNCELHKNLINEKRLKL